MATINKFEDIEAWQKARELAKRVYTATRGSDFARDFGLRDQIQRASVSIVSNIAEGFDRDGNAEFVQFLSHAKGSTGEVKAQLYLALDLQYITLKEFEDLFTLATEAGRMIAGLMNYLRNSELKGNKFKTRN